VNFKVFVIASIAARGLRFFVIAILIRLFGDSIRTFIEQHLNWLTIAFVILLVLGFWVVGRGAKHASGTTPDATDTRDS
jgi:putative Mn2+ efflux pump MntP